MDWGLFDRNAGENTFLREEIVYPHKVFGTTDRLFEFQRTYFNPAVFCTLSLQAYYYCAIVEDVLLRFVWILTITLTSLTSFSDITDVLATVLAPLEVFR